MDDTVIIQALGTHMFQNSPDDTVKRIQQLVDCLEGVTKSAGGEIASDEPWWYTIYFEWEN